MAYHKAVSELMSFSVNSYYMWKKENRPIISLLHKYLTEEDINEFLTTGSISKFDNIDYIKYDFNKSYFEFLVNIKGELKTFLELVELNQNDLLTFSSNFISIVINYNCENPTKSKLIESYSKVEDKNKLFYFGLKNMLNDKFKDFYIFSLEYSRADKKYNLAIEHLKLYIKILSPNIGFLSLVEMFPELASKEFVFTSETLKDYGYLDYDKKYYEYLLELI